MKPSLAMATNGAGGFAEPRQTPRGDAASAWAAWLVLIGLIIPAAEVQVHIVGAKFTVGRLGIALLFLPALFRLLGGDRRLGIADLLAAITAAWMIGAALAVSGSSALSSAGAEAFEFLGGYLTARAYFFTPSALKAFVGALKPLAAAAVLFAVADRVSGHLVVQNFWGSLLHVPAISDQYRMGVLRAASTFDHAIMFGLFCAVAATLIVYSEEKPLQRVFYTSVCFLGGYLSLSSSGLMAFAILFGAYAYDHAMHRFAWRWTACLAGFGLLGVAVVLTANNPLGWVLSNLTLDPASSYFRILEWNAAIGEIAQSPWTGYAFREFGTAELYSVDTVWLAFALRFGLPMISALLLANMLALAPARTTGDPYLDRMRTAFCIVLVMFMFVGLTAHFWNYMWIFWGVCLGIAVSLRDAARPAQASRRR